MSTNGSEPATGSQNVNGQFVRWLDEEVVSRLDICKHLLGNGRTDDRSAGIQLVLNEIIAEIQKRSRDVSQPE
jgi:hypothetical protein